MLAVDLVAFSRADDLSYRSLDDAVTITQDVNARVVGGHMVALLGAAFPVGERDLRYTRDSDVAVETAIASSGALHDALIARDYTDGTGNHYEKFVDGEGVLEIDILVPSPSSQFEPQLLGGRAFDGAPGLMLALALEPLLIRVTATLLTEDVLTLDVRVPPVEVAVILKAIAYEQRREPRDLEDLLRLLEIAAATARDAIGGWTLDGPGLTATRAQAAGILHGLSARVRSLPDVAGRARLTALVAALITAS